MNTTVEEGDNMKSRRIKDKTLWRDLLAYWFLGLCNNYGYVVMLSAAHDILTEFGNKEHLPDENIDNDVIYENQRKCNYISTGAILLADILPALMIKSLAPFIPMFIHVRVGACCILAACGFLLVAFANYEWIAIMGVVATSLASGLGEATFLQYSSYYNKNVISTWSSGTGGAGIVGSISYAGLRSFGLNSSTTLLIMLIVPIIEAISFWIILRHDHHNIEYASPNDNDTENNSSIDGEPHFDEFGGRLDSVMSKIKFIPRLFIFMIPLTLVYLFEYFINQGLFELVYFNNVNIDNGSQYRWYQVTYQIGVFISRSSVNIISFSQIWIMAVLQLINVFYFVFEVFLFFTPNIWIVFVIILWEGLLGGGAYVNTFYRMSKVIPFDKRKFAMGVVSMSDSIGIAMAGIFAIPAHNAICGLPEPIR